MKKVFFLALLPASLFLSGCWFSRYVSADKDLEDIYVGKSYYEVVDDFGRPDATVDDGMQGTRAVYNAVSLNGTRAASLYQSYNMRNRTTKVTGEPAGYVAFSFNAKMVCYAVNSDLQHERVKAPKVKEAPRDPNRWAWQNPKVPRQIDFPVVDSRSVNAEVVSIERIDVNKESTKVYFRYHSRTPVHRPVPDNGISIMQDVYIEDIATGKRFSMLEVDGISIYPEPTYFAHNDGGYDVLNYVVTFEPVDRTTVKINIIEPGHSGFNFYGVDISTRIAPRLE